MSSAAARSPAHGRQQRAVAQRPRHALGDAGQPRRLDAVVEHLGRLVEPAAHEVRRPERREQRRVQAACCTAEPQCPLGVCDRVVVAVQVRGGRREVGGGVDAGAELLVGHRGDQRRRLGVGGLRLGDVVRRPRDRARGSRRPRRSAGARRARGPLAARALPSRRPTRGPRGTARRSRARSSARSRRAPRGPGAARGRRRGARAPRRGGRAGARRRRTSSSAARAGPRHRPGRARCSRAGRHGSRRGGPARRARAPAPAAARRAARRARLPAGGAGPR